MKTETKGFTLIELLIVIGIIAILAVVVLLTLNPAELLRQARDSNRIQDLASVNSAIGFYLADQSSLPANPVGTYNICYNTLTTIAASTGSDPTVIECETRYRSSTVTGNTAVNSATTGASVRAINATGWIPVNFQTISAGSPLPTLPVDPSNNGTNFYAYRASNTVYKLTGRFESIKFASSAVNDGGIHNSIYEIGAVTQL